MISALLNLLVQAVLLIALFLCLPLLLALALGSIGYDILTGEPR